MIIQYGLDFPFADGGTNACDDDIDDYDDDHDDHNDDDHDDDDNDDHDDDDDNDNDDTEEQNMTIQRRPDCPFADDGVVACDDDEDEDGDEVEDEGEDEPGEVAYLIVPGVIHHCPVCKVPYFPNETPKCKI